jgi:signal transduction histidine kinase
MQEQLLSMSDRRLPAAMRRSHLPLLMSFNGINILKSGMRYIVVFCLSVALLSGTKVVAQERTSAISGTPDSASIWGRIKIGNRLLVREGSNKDSALQQFQLALKESKQIRFYRGMVISTLGIGGYYYHSGEYEKAIETNKQAYIYAEQMGNDQCRSQIENNMAIAYSGLGDYELALQHYLTALKYADKDTSRMAKAALQLNIGDLLIRSRKDSMALSYLEQAENLGKERNHPYLLGMVSINKGVAYNNLGALLKGKAYLLKARDIAADNGFFTMEEQALLHLATNSREAGDIKEALQYTEDGLKVNSIQHAVKMGLLLQKGLSYFELKEYDKAETSLLSALDSSKSAGNSVRADRATLSDLYQALAKTYRAQGRFDKAIEYYEAYYTIKDSIFKSTFNGKVDRLQQDFEAASKNNELIKKELLISQQKATIQKKNIVTCGIILLSLLSGSFLFMHFRTRQRMQKQENEIATWRASMDGEEKERTRLARQLHDSIGGSLSTVQMWFGTLQKRHREIGSSGDYGEAMQLLGSTLAEVRETAHHLMPELLLRHGLTEAVRIFCNTVQKAGHLKIEYQYYGYIGQLNSSLELIIYRHIQELLQNVVKHADASFALVQLSRHDNILSVTVEDNGRGMDEVVLNSPGMGLQNIKRNINNMTGQFSINSSKGKGCTVYFEINVDEQEF